MIVKEVFDYLVGLSSGDYNETDTLKFGTWEQEVTKIAICFILTIDVIKKAKEWGADLIITHEPTLFENLENFTSGDRIVAKKLELIKDAGFSVIRFHDYMHGCSPDMIGEGEFFYMQLDGKYLKGRRIAINRFVCENEITPLELAELIESNLGIKHIRICGARDIKCKNISACFGQPSLEGVFEELRDDDVEIVLVGEVCEWSHGEYVRDAALLGEKKAMLIMGHAGSERDGMKFLSKKLSEEFDDIQIKYFDSGEVYSYTD